MRPKLLMVRVLVMILATIGCQPTQRCVPLSEEDIVEIKLIEQHYIDNTVSGNWEGVAALLTDDVVMMGPDRPLEMGRDAVRARFEAAAHSIADLTITDSEIRGEGNLACLRWTWTVTPIVGGSPSPITFKGKSIVILRRQVAGSWLIALESYSLDQPITSSSAEKE